MSKHLLWIVIALLFASGCSTNPEVQVVELSKNTVVYDEIVRINNCGGKGDSEQTASREFATTVEFGAGISAGYQSVVQGNLSAKYSEYRNISKSQRLVLDHTDFRGILLSTSGEGRRPWPDQRNIQFNSLRNNVHHCADS